MQAARGIPNKGTTPTSDALQNLKRGLTRKETKCTFGELTKLFLHVRHRILLRSIVAVDQRVGALYTHKRTGASALVAFNSQCDLVTGMLLLILGQLRLFGLYSGVQEGWLVSCCMTVHVVLGHGRDRSWRAERRQANAYRK